MSGLFSKPKVPPIAPPTPMPTMDSEEVKKAKMRQMSAAAQRTGRASTILTGSDTDKLG